MLNVRYIVITTLLLLLLVCPVQSAQNTIYQQTFTRNPGWYTNNPSSNYWNPNLSMYHFGIEPGTGNQAYPITVLYNDTSFSLEYDVVLMQVDEGATFRLGFSGNDIDRSEGPNIITEFTNDYKYGNIMRLRVVTSESKLQEVSSNTESYGGQSIHFELNKTYHVIVNYNLDTSTIIIRVLERSNNKQIWSYYIELVKPIKGMKRIYIGSVGDYYNMQNIYAIGYMDNIYLYSTPIQVVTKPPTVIPTPVNTPYIATPLPTRTPLVVTPTSVPTQQASGIIILPIVGVGFMGLIWRMRK